MKKNFYLIVGLLILQLCFSFILNDKKNGKIKRIKHGVSFGMCEGYCLTECEIDSLQKTIKRSSWQKDKYPNKVTTVSVTREEWNILVQEVNLAEFVKLPNKIGCPDCLDGGAEWIEIKYGNNVKKVTFEYGQDIQGISKLLKEVRKNN